MYICMYICIYICALPHACLSEALWTILGASDIYFIIPGRKVENTGGFAVHNKLLATSPDLV